MHNLPDHPTDANDKLFAAFVDLTRRDLLDRCAVASLWTSQDIERLPKDRIEGIALAGLLTTLRDFIELGEEHQA